MWDDSVADALEPSGDAADETLADVDVYLKDGAYFELFGAAAFVSLDQEPMASPERLQEWLTTRVTAGLWLIDMAVDEEDALVLVLGEKSRPSLYLAVGAWALGEWEELPDE